MAIKGWASSRFLFPLDFPFLYPSYKDIHPITMLATSHKPFAFYILPINLYSSKILAGFIAQIFDSTRPGGLGGISFQQRLREFLRTKNSDCRNIVSRKRSSETKF